MWQIRVVRTAADGYGAEVEASCPPAACDTARGGVEYIAKVVGAAMGNSPARGRECVALKAALIQTNGGVVAPVRERYC